MSCPFLWQAIFRLVFCFFVSHEVKKYAWVKNLKIDGSYFQVTSSFINRSLAAGADIEIDRYFRSIFETAATPYDKAMDLGRKLKGEFGPDHRIFDGTHDLLGAWEAAKTARSNDSRAEEILSFMEAYWKDLVTPMGMPFITLGRANFENASAFASKLGIEESWLIDLVSFTETEGAGALAAIIGASMNLREEDIDIFAEHSASIGATAIFAANPLALTVAIILLARSYKIGEKQDKVGNILNRFGWGTAKSATFIGTAAILGGPA